MTIFMPCVIGLTASLQMTLAATDVNDTRFRAFNTLRRHLTLLYSWRSVSACTQTDRHYAVRTIVLPCVHVTGSGIMAPTRKCRTAVIYVELHEH